MGNKEICLWFLTCVEIVMGNKAPVLPFPHSFTHLLLLLLSSLVYVYDNWQSVSYPSMSVKWKTTSKDGKCAVGVLVCFWRAPNKQIKMCFLFICVHNLLVNHIHRRESVCCCLKRCNRFGTVFMTLWMNRGCIRTRLGRLSFIERMIRWVFLSLFFFLLVGASRSLSSFWFLCVHLTQFIANCEPFCLDPNCQLMFAQSEWHTYGKIAVGYVQV